MLYHKQIFISICLIFTFVFVHAQGGYVFYKKQLSYELDQDIEENMKHALNQLDKQEYQLTFSKNRGSYMKIESLSINNNPMVDAIVNSFSDFNGKIFFDNSKKTVVHQKEFSGNIFLIYKKTKHWKLINETMTIDGYLCYKATTQRVIQNADGVHNLMVTAWYAPEIPLPYGPDGYGGLPGLILQLENNSILTVIKKIKFSNNNPVEINFPNMGERITEDDFDAMAKKMWEKRKDN